MKGKSTKGAGGEIVVGQRGEAAQGWEKATRKKTVQHLERVSAKEEGAGAGMTTSKTRSGLALVQAEETREK